MTEIPLYQDTFKPRPFQSEVIEAVRDGMASGRDFSVILASPGSGKTLTYQALATELWRDGLIDHLAVFVPRLVLGRQCEISWRHQAGNDWFGDHRLFDERKRLGMIRHTPNRRPLTPPGELGSGFVSTYAGLVTKPGIFDEWAREHEGRFLLVADEAQSCGAAGENDEDEAGTRAGEEMVKLHRYAAHTVLMTGTPYRSDNQPLILAQYGDVDPDTGRKKLIHHAEASYFDGVAEGYLRRFDAMMTDGRATRRFLKADVAVEYDISRDSRDLKEVLKKPEVWQPLVEHVVAALRQKQQQNPAYRALISCMEQREARSVLRYIEKNHPTLQTRIAVSDDGPEAERALREFKAGPADLLVTVRKAFIGYDCPEITVVGILTHYRDPGHLLQLVGRGLRMWSGHEKKSQSCRVIAPDDPEMQKFIRSMQEQSDEGLRVRAQREKNDDEAGGPGGGSDTRDYYIEAAYATSSRVMGPDGEVPADQLSLIESMREEFGLVDDASQLAKLVRAFTPAGSSGEASPRAAAVLVKSAPVGGFPKTEAERIDAVQSTTRDTIASNLARRGILPGTPTYRDAMIQETSLVNRRAGLTSKQVRTVEDAERRLAAATELGLPR